MLWALKPAEEGVVKGIVARVWNPADQAVDYRLSLESGLAEAWHVTHIETDLRRASLQDGVLTARIARHQFQTHRLLMYVPN